MVLSFLIFNVTAPEEEYNTRKFSYFILLFYSPSGSLFSYFIFLEVLFYKDGGERISQERKEKGKNEGRGERLEVVRTFIGLFRLPRVNVSDMSLHKPRKIMITK